MGGTGLEPVTPSLSTRSPALHPVMSYMGECGTRGFVSGFPARLIPRSVTRWNELYRTFRHCPGTASVAYEENLLLTPS
jgi:hypothetical protein